MKFNYHSIKVKLLIIPILLLLIGVIIIGGAASNFLQNNLLDQKRAEGRRLTEQVERQISDNSAAVSTVESVIEDRIYNISQLIISNEEKLDNRYLEELSQQLNVVEINWFSQEGEIIYSSISDYVGWSPDPDHVLYEFGDNNQQQVMEDIREDDISGDFRKYGAVKAPGGGFVQIGVNADEINQLTDAFGLQALVDELAADQEVTYALFINMDLEAEAHSDHSRVGISLDDPGSRAAIENQEFYASEYYFEAEGINVYDVILPLIIDDEQVGAINIGYSMLPVYQMVFDSLKLIGLIGLVIFIVLALILYRNARNILIPLEGAVDQCDKMSNKDFSNSLDKKWLERKDEIGVLIRALDNIRVSIGGIIKDILNKAENLSAFSQELSASGEEVATSAEQVGESIQQIASGAEEQSAQVEETSSNIEELIVQIQNVKKNSNQMDKQADNVMNNIEQGNSSVNESVEKIEKVKDNAAQVSDSINELGELSNKIGEIVDLINNIADQTNLLALNAAIEAARAGEAGRGFSVVADEIRELAEESSGATDKINALIKKIQNSVKDAVGEMDSAGKVVNESVSSIDNTGKSFAEINLAAKNLRDLIAEISNKADIVDQNSTKVEASVKEIASVSQEAASNSEEVAAASEEQSASTEEIVSAAENLSEMAADLTNLVNQFKL